MRSKRLFVFMLLLCVAGVLLAGLEVKQAQAVPVETTKVIYSDTDDGHIARTNPSYGNAHNGTTGTVHSDSTSFYVGQKLSFSIYRGFLFFDTSTIPDSANVTGVKVSLYFSTYQTSKNFNITVQHGEGPYPHKPLGSGDYYYVHYSGKGGTLNFTDLSFGYQNITMNTEGVSWINVGGNTKLCLRSNRDIGYIQPSADENIGFRSREVGLSYAPKLYVTYEYETYNYLVHGPYWESGAVANKVVNITLQIQNMPSQKYVLNGTDGIADLLNISVEQRGVAFTWNFSSLLYNQTRTYCLTTATFDELWIFIPDLTADYPCNLYTFTVTDFVGVTNAYLETVHNVGGYNRIVERQSLAVINELPFWMVWAHKYDIRLICDQGTYNWGSFIAGAQQQQSLIIIEGMFPETYPGMNVTCKAARMNATWIQANYTDSQAKTSWVKVVIQYKSGQSWVTAYTTNSTGNTQQVDWYGADSKTDYVVKVSAMRTRLLTWSFSCPKPAKTTGPWGDLDALGEWPIPPGAAIGLAITLGVFVVFSYHSLTAGCILGTLMATFFTYIGWLPCPWSLLGLAWFISVITAIAEAKKKEREI